MKYFVYISKTKISMLEEQAPQSFWSRVLAKIKPEIGFEKFGFKAKLSADNLDLSMQQTHLDKALGSLAADDEIGTVDRPRSWFKGELAMKWGAFQDYAADLVLFSGASDRTQVYLLGSIYSLVGRAEDKDANHSIDYYT